MFTLDTKKYIEDENIWVIFKEFDIDNDGIISAMDLESALNKAGCHFNNEEIQELIEEFELNGNK